MEIRVALIDKNTPDTGDDFKTFRQFMQQEIGKAIPTPDSMRENVALFHLMQPRQKGKQY